MENNIKPISNELLNKKPGINDNMNNSFHIRRRKTFLIDQKPKMYKNEAKKRNSYAYSTYNVFQNQRKMSFHKIRRRSSLTKDFRALEEDVRCSILEMRRNCLWEIRRQSHDISTLFESIDNNIKTNSSIGNIKRKFSMKFLEDLELNKENNNIYGLKKCKTVNIKKVKYNKKSNNNKKTEMENNDMNKDLGDKTNKKLLSSKELLRLRHKGRKSLIIGEKFRFLGRGGQIIDSYNENESDEDSEPEGLLLNPETKFVFIYDAIIAFVALYSLIYIPIELAKNFCFCSSNPNSFKTFINFIFDILFVIDLIIEFFREFYTKEDEKLIKNSIKIIHNYIRGWFFLDLLASLPSNILIFYFCKNQSNKICFTFQKNNNLIDFLMLFRCLKALKVFKISTRKKNQFVTEIVEKCSDYSILDQFMDLFSKISFIIAGLHLLSCIHIFIGRHVYPGWIFKNQFQNYSLINLYMISLYYMITTMTTVGYGEISSDSFIEIVFRIILLAVGIICYSWLISSISNGINKQSYASINYSNECLLLESIRRSHRELPYKIYFAIKKHLEYKHFRQKIFDKDLLINNLPYSLKNNLIFSMYKNAIEKLDFFKGISNTNFLAETLRYFTPISGKKNDIFIKENELIEEIYFVLEGRLALEVPINMDNPEESVNKYLSNDFLDFAFEFDFEANYNMLPDISNFNSNLYDNSDIYGTRRTNIFNSFIIKHKESKKNFENNVYLKIHDIHKNEDFGDIYVFFSKRSPFALRAKTKRVKLYGIKKDNFANLCKEYQHLFRRINKKKKHNYKIIKNILIKTISKFCDVKGIKINDRFKDNIYRAIKELQKENVPIDILKDGKNKNEISEIDEQINSTIKEFDSQIQSKIEGNNYDKKNKNKILNKLLKINTTAENEIKNDTKNINLYNANIKGTAITNNIKHSFLQNFNLEGTNNYNYTSSIQENKKYNSKNIKKSLIRKNNGIKRKKQIKTVIRSNIISNMNLKGYDFDFTESDESIKTVKLKDNNESYESSPNTIKILPQSLINLLKTKINYQQLLNKKSTSKNAPIFTTIKYNNNIINNNNNYNTNNVYEVNKINFQSKIKNNSNIKSKNMSSSGFTFDKLINKHFRGEKEFSNLINSKFEKSSYSKINPNNKKKLSKVNSIRDTLTPNPYFSPIIRGKNNKNIIYPQNQFNNYQKCSITNNNILLKLDEHILNKYNIFNYESLSFTTTDSFQIKRCYKNINDATNGVYIKDKKFQSDTLQFIMDYKNNKSKNFKKNNSKTSFNTVKNLVNFIPIDNNIKSVDSRMNIYLSNKLKLIKKKTLNLKKKTPFFKKSNKTKLSNNHSINSSSNSINNSNFYIKSLNEDTIMKLNNNNDINYLKYDDIT